MNQVLCRVAALTLLSIAPLAACRAKPVELAKPASLPSRSGGAGRMDWWREARFGMFLHWGLYSIPAGKWGDSTSHAEWIMTTAQIPVERYERLREQFNPVGFDAEEWARMAADAGMKYIVITSKHHDGFALYDSKVSDYDVMATPFGRDILKELSEAARRHGLVMCFYHSIMDWHHPDYVPRRDWETRSAEGADFGAYRRYLSRQVSELLTNYGPIGVMWFDGEWEPTWTNEYGKELYALCRKLQPEVIVNNRVSTGRAGMAGMTKGADFPGDFGTPEQEIPAQGLPGVDWETCMTMNDHWGFNAADRDWKTSEDLVQKLCDIASKGGNFLLNVGPTAEGKFPPEAVDRLAAIGRWMKVNSEAIWDTQASPLDAQNFGRVTLRPGAGPKDPSTLYLHVFDWPVGGILTLEGLGNGVRSAKLLADPAREVRMAKGEGRIVLELGQERPDSQVSVVRLELDGPPIVFAAPRILTRSPRFLESAQVEIVPPSPQVQVRYTYDGSEVEAASARVKGPITIKGTCTLRARSFFEGKPVGKESTLRLEQVTPRPAQTIAGAGQGLLRERFEGDFDRLPDFTALTSTASEPAARVELPEGPREERVAFVWSGLVRASQRDVYTFALTSDDGSRLFIDGEVVVDNDGLHGAEERRGDIALAAGWHAIRVEWFNKSGGAELVLAMGAGDAEPAPIGPGDLARPPTDPK
jgi:alpha-L-fucosidase